MDNNLNPVIDSKLARMVAGSIDDMCIVNNTGLSFTHMHVPLGRCLCTGTTRTEIPNQFLAT